MNKWLKAELDYWKSQRSTALATLELYFNDSVGIGEHSDITEAIGVELDKISRYHDQLEVINHYFKKR